MFFKRLSLKREVSQAVPVSSIPIRELLGEILFEILLWLRSRREKKTLLLLNNQVPAGRRMISKGLNPRDFQPHDIYLDPSQSEWSGKIGEPRFK